jgi:hypothetical protein
VTEQWSWPGNEGEWKPDGGSLRCCAQAEGEEVGVVASAVRIMRGLGPFYRQGEAGCGGRAVHGGNKSSAMMSGFSMFGFETTRQEEETEGRRRFLEVEVEAAWLGARRATSV